MVHCVPCHGKTRLREPYCFTVVEYARDHLPVHTWYALPRAGPSRRPRNPRTSGIAIVGSRRCTVYTCVPFSAQGWVYSYIMWYLTNGPASPNMVLTTDVLCACAHGSIRLVTTCTV